MKKLPVIAVIREAYDFTFANLGAIIALIWLPMVIATVGDFFVTREAAAAPQTVTGAGNAALLQLFFLLVKLALYAMMFVPVAQLALGQRQPGAMFHFAFGAPEWRMFRALMGLMILLLPAGAAFALLLAGTPAVAGPLPAGAAQLVILLLLAGVLYAQMRFASLLVPLVVTEEKALLMKSWMLTAGNVWRLLAVWAGTLLPPSFLMALAMLTVLPIDHTIAPTPAAVTAAMQQQMPLLMGLQFLFAPLLIGLFVGAGVFSWRALTRTDIVA